MQCRINSLKNIWGIWKGQLFINLGMCPSGAGLPQRLLQKPKSWQLYFLSLSPSMNTQPPVATCGNQYDAHIHYLTCLYQPPPHWASVDSPFPVMLASVLALWVLSPRRLVQTLPILHTFCRASVPAVDPTEDLCTPG